MKKTEFLSELAAHLKKLPPEERERTVEYYREMLEEAMEDGKTEEEAVAMIGLPETVAAEVLHAAAEKAEETEKPVRKKVNGWKILCIVLLSPIWLPVLCTLAALVIALFCVVWAIVAAFWSVFAAVAVSALAALVTAVGGFFIGGVWYGMLFLGGACVCAAFAILFFFVSLWITRAILSLTSLLFIGWRKKVRKP